MEGFLILPEYVEKATPAERLASFVSKMQGAVRDYLAAKARIERPRTGLARLLQGAAQRVQMFAARAKLRRDLRYLVAQAHTDAATLGLDRPLDSLDMPALRAIVNQELASVEKFIMALDGLSEAEAMRPASLYQYAVAQTRSVMAAIELPLSLPILPGDRRLACKGFCRCSLTITKLPGEANYDITWDLHPEAEHCPDCERLSLEWTPLAIRNGVIRSVKAVSTHDRNAYEKLGRTLGASLQLEESLHGT